MSLYSLCSNSNTGYQIHQDSSQSIALSLDAENDLDASSVYSTAISHNFPTPCYAYYYADPGAYVPSSAEEYNHYSYGLVGEPDNIFALPSSSQTQIFPLQPFLDDDHNCLTSALPDDALPTCHSTAQTPAAVQGLSSFPRTSLPQDDLASTSFPTPLEQLTDQANNVQAAVHEYPADPRFRKKSALRPNEIRQRRADRRKAKVLTVSSALSFSATDPDTMTSHEKKRLYVGGLEQYIVWMEEQVRLLGRRPRSMQSLPNYKGISSRSLRTMLAHFQDEAEKLNTLLKSKEQIFLELESQVRCQGSPDSASSFTRDLSGNESIGTNYSWL